MERRILLVDDEENVTSALVRLLRRDGYEILRANSGLDGLQLLEQNKVGVIISDQLMAGMTGVEFLSRVKELYPDTMRIVLSGYTELKSVTEAINRGAVYKFLTKPWEDEQLCEHVRDAFSHFEMKIENARLNLDIKEANDKLQEINRELEQSVENKTRDIVRNLDILKISQEILSHLPVAVLGIGEDGMIAIANECATKLFSSATEGVLGEMARDVIPAELISMLDNDMYIGDSGKDVSFSDGRKMHCWIGKMGEFSKSKGKTIVIDMRESAQ